MIDANESWIDERQGRGKNEFNVGLRYFQNFANENFTSVGDRPMGKHPQDRFRRLAIVGPAENNRQQHSAAGQRWWGPKRPDNHASTQEKAHFRSLRMAVMPTFSRGMWIEAMTWLGSFLRSYFVAAGSRRRGAVVLSFRGHAARAHGFRRMVADEAFGSKKASGSVRWNRDRGVAPQEGGRG